MCQFMVYMVFLIFFTIFIVLFGSSDFIVGFSLILPGVFFLLCYVVIIFSVSFYCIFFLFSFKYFSLFWSSFVVSYLSCILLRNKVLLNVINFSCRANALFLAEIWLFIIWLFIIKPKQSILSISKYTKVEFGVQPSISVPSMINCFGPWHAVKWSKFFRIFCWIWRRWESLEVFQSRSVFQQKNWKFWKSGRMRIHLNNQSGMVN